MKWAMAAIVALTALLGAAVFLPCARVPIMRSSLGPPEYVVKHVGVTLLDDIPAPYAIYLLTLPALSAFACVFLLGLRMSARATAWAGFAGAAYLVLPSVSVPGVKVGALLVWRWCANPLFVMVTGQLLYGYHAYAGLLFALAGAWLALGIAGLVAARRARREKT